MSEPLTEEEREALFDALDAQHDHAYHVHAAECCWPFVGAISALAPAVEAIVAARVEKSSERVDDQLDRQAATAPPEAFHCAESKAWYDNYDGMFWRWMESDTERLRLKTLVRDTRARLRFTLYLPTIAEEIRMFADAHGSWTPLELAEHLDAQVISPAIAALRVIPPESGGRAALAGPEGGAG